MSDAKERFEKSLSTKSRSFQKNAKSLLNRFLKKNGLTLEEIYQKQLATQRAIQNGEMEPYENFWLPNLVKDFMKDMLERGSSPGYTRQIITYMKFFLKASAMDFRLNPEDYPQGEDIGKTVITYKQINTIWDQCTAEFKLRNRALIAMLKDSGLRPIDLTKLNVENFLLALEESPHTGFAKFRPIITSKKGTKGHPRIGPDAVEAITLYLNGRKTGPLFESKKINKATNRPEPELKRMLPGDISSVFNTLTKVLKNGDQVAAYSLRKFHSTELNSSRPDLDLPSMSEAYIAMLQGKKRQGSFGPYNQPWETGKLLDEYVRHYPKLSLTPEIISARTEQELIRLRKEVERINGLEAQLEFERKNKIEKDREFRDLAEEVKWMRPILQDMIDEKRERDRIMKAAKEP